MPQKTVVCTGDSITQGGGFYLPQPYPQLLQGRLGWPVTNAGMGGDTTTIMLARYGAIIAYLPHFDYVVISGGINDIPDAVYNPALTRSNITAMCDRALAVGITPIVCKISPRCNIANYSARVTAHNEWIEAFALENDYGVIDFYTLLEDPAHPGCTLPAYSYDGYLHPNQLGINAVVAAIDLRIFGVSGQTEVTDVVTVCEVATTTTIPVGWNT